MISKLPGPIAANALSVNWKPTELESYPFAQSALNVLATPLHFEGGSQIPHAQFVLLEAGLYEVTWDLSSFTLPTVTAHKDYAVIPYLYIVGYSQLLRSITYNPVPSNITQGRVLAHRANHPYIEFIAYEGNVTKLGINKTLTTVIRLLGVPVCRRWYWSMCETYP